MSNKGRKLSKNPTLRTYGARAAKMLEHVTECERCGHDGTRWRLEVHHRDRNPTNNARANLEKLCSRCHGREHRGDPRKVHRPRIVNADRTCRHEGCPRPVKARGYCGTHYAQRRRSGALGLKPKAQRTCNVAGCNAKHEAHGLCRRHYLRAYHAQRADHFGASAA